MVASNTWKHNLGCNDTPLIVPHMANFPHSSSCSRACLLSMRTIRLCTPSTQSSSYTIISPYNLKLTFPEKESVLMK